MIFCYWDFEIHVIIKILLYLTDLDLITIP